MIPIQMPQDQEGTVSTVGSWLKQVGEQVSADEALVELETDKVNTEIASPASGVLHDILVEVGDQVSPGQVLGHIADAATGTAEPEVQAATSEPAVTTPATPAAALEAVPADALAAAPKPAGASRAHLLSPSVRKLFAQHKLDASMIQGTGRGGRITFKDVTDYLANRPIAPKPAVTAPVATPVRHIDAGGQMVPHDRMRRQIADHMVESLLRTAPHVTAVFEMDLSAVIAHRKAHKEAFAREGVALTFTAYFVQASVAALRAVPQVNSRFHPDALEIFADHNIGVGTALGDKGLIVPVIHQAQNLSLQGTAAKLQDVTERARTGKLKPADTQNGTFTISNHGVSGSLIATPIIINQPQSAILGIGKMQKRVVVQETPAGDVMAIRPMCYVTLSIDHRALDAHQCNAFLSIFVDTIENWS